MEIKFEKVKTLPQLLVPGTIYWVDDLKTTVVAETEYKHLIYNGGKINIDEYLSSDSENPVMNKTITEKFNKIPFEKGEVDNSAVLKGEYLGKSNKAISLTSIALGAATTAGMKGWYYSNIDFTNNTITFSDVQPHLENGVLVGGSWSSDMPNISIDDELTIINNSIYDLKSKVVAVNNNIITVDNIPFDSYANVSIESQDVHDWVIYVPAKPNNGIINLGFAAHAEGVVTKATAPGAHSEGLETHAYGHYSHTEGRDTMAGYAAHAEGRRSIARGEHSHAQGLATIAEGNNSFTTGRDTKAYGDNSSALGYKSESHGENSLSSGITSKAKGVNSVALGNNVNAEGDNTFAEGNNTINKGNSSHTEGLFSKVDIQDGELTDRFHRQNGYAAHAEGYTSLAVGCGAHSEGMLTKAIGAGAHSEGYRTIAKAGSSHAEGSYTETKNSSEHAQGKYNKSNTNTIHSVGIGSSDKRKNAHEIMQDGKHYIYGVGGYDGTNPDSSNDLAKAIANGDVCMVNITYDELVSLRDNSQLKAGMFYRITDYEATSSDSSTLCPNFLPFDVVVRAVSNRCLSVDAIGLLKSDSAHEILRLDYYLSQSEGPFFDWWLPKGKLSYRVTEINADVIADEYLYIIWSFDEFSEDLHINGDKVIGEITNYYVTEDGTIYKKADSAYFGKGIPVSSKGLVARLRDAYGNDFPYDYLNIIVKGITSLDDSTYLPSGNAGIYPASISSGNVRNVVVEPLYDRGTFKIPKVRIMPYSVRNVHIGKNCTHILLWLSNTSRFPPLSIGEGCGDIKSNGCSVGSYCDRLRLLGGFTFCKVGNFVNGLHIKGYFVNLKLNDGCGCFKSRGFCTISCDYTTSTSTVIHDVTLDGPFEVESYSIKKSPDISNSHTTIAADSNGVIKEFNLADLAN